MTLEEAKKILEKEGFKLGGPGKPGKPGVVSEAFAEYESPEICEAMQIVCSAGFQLAMLAGVFDERKERLKKEYEKNTKAPCSGEEQPKENGLKAATDAFILQANEIMRLKKKNAELLEAIDKMKNGNPALAESASKFNDALLDEQAKKIAELIKEKSNLEDQITVLNACKKHNDKIDRKQIKCLGKEIARLNGIIHDKNAILSDVAEELRLTKIREKNLAELGLKYVGENEKLKEQLADKVVDKIDAQALRSAESALAWKEKVVTYKDMALAYDEKKIADLGKELKAQKYLVDDISLKYDGAKHNLKLRIEECEKLKKELEKMTKLVETVRNSSKEYCDYGVAANEFIKELAHLYVLASNNGIINIEMLERCKNYQTYGFPANCNRKTKKEINDIARGKENKKPRIPTPEEPKHDNGFEDFINKTIDNYNRRAANLGCVGSKDGNGIFDQMVGVDIAEEGKDHSGVIVLCGKDFVKKYKENKEFVHDFFKRHKETAEELYEVADDACEQLLLFGEIIIKSEK